MSRFNDWSDENVKVTHLEDQSPEERADTEMRIERAKKREQARIEWNLKHPEDPR